MGGLNVPLSGDVIHSLGIFSMDSTPHIGQCSFTCTCNDGMTNTDIIAVGMKNTRIQKSVLSINPNKMISFLGPDTK